MRDVITFLSILFLLVGGYGVYNLYNQNLTLKHRCEVLNDKVKLLSDVPEAEVKVIYRDVVGNGEVSIVNHWYELVGDTTSITSTFENDSIGITVFQKIFNDSIDTMSVDYVLKFRAADSLIYITRNVLVDVPTEMLTRRVYVGANLSLYNQFLTVEYYNKTKFGYMVGYDPFRKTPSIGIKYRIF